MLPTEDTDQSAATASFGKTNNGGAATSVGHSQPQPDAADDAELELTPERIGTYRILRQAGRGGFGIVYEGLDTQLNTRVAIKVARLDRVRESDDSLLAEARTQAKLRHPHIVRVLSADRTEAGQVYLVMDWLGGPSLRDHMAGRQLPLHEALQIIIQVAEAIHCAHKLDFVHRDLKPTNILLDENHKPYVADFGLAIDDATQRLRRDEIAGTVAYMSPEQIRAESQYLDGRTDVWALGVMLYEMLGGKRPFRGEYEALRAEILNRTPKPLRLLNEQVPRSLESIVNKCLEKDVRQRTPTAQELCEQLKRELSDLQPANRRRPSWHPWLVGLGCLLPVLAASFYAFRSIANAGSDNQPPGQIAHTALPGGVPAVHSSPSFDAALGDVTYLPQRWNKVLDQPLVKRLWPPPSSRSLLSVDADLEQFTAVVDGVANLKAGTIDFNHGSIRFDVHQADWAGNFSIYYGWQADVDAPGEFLCEHVELVRVSERLGKQSHRLQREILYVDSDFKPKGTVALSSSPIPSPQAAAKTCVLTFHDGQLESLTWDGQQQPSLLANRYLQPPVGCKGDFGFYARETTLTVAQFRIFPDVTP